MTETHFPEVHLGNDKTPVYPYNPKKRPKPKQRRKLIMGRLAQNDKCVYCGIKMVFLDPSERRHDEVTLDHKTPIAKGADGRKRKNIVLACFTCNQNKKEMTEEEYRATIKFKNRVEHVRHIDNATKGSR